MVPEQPFHEAGRDRGWPGRLPSGVIVSDYDGSPVSTPDPDSVARIDDATAATVGPAEQRRWLVHCGLMAAVVVTFATLTITYDLPLHREAGLVFAGLVVTHLGQRKRTARILTGALVRLRSWLTRRGRLAWSDAVLAFLAVNTVVSGLVDWISGRKQSLPMPGGAFLSWHGASALLLTVYLIVHVVRRWRRLRSS